MINHKQLCGYDRKNKMGIGDWGLGIGDGGLGQSPNPECPIPNPQTERS